MSDFNQRRQKVEHQYNADEINFQVVHESSVGAIVRALFGTLSGGNAEQIEKVLPEDASGLYAILIETLSQLVRRERLTFKREKLLFSGINASGGVSDLISRFTKDRQSKKDAARRQELCEKIVEKLHALAIKSRDRTFLEDVEELDECMLRVTAIEKKNQSLPNTKAFLWLGLCGAVPIFFAFIVSLFGEKASAASDVGAMLFLLVFEASAVAVPYFLFRRGVAFLEHNIAEAQTTVNRLASRHPG